jgi:hypothetical protein
MRLSNREWTFAGTTLVSIGLTLFLAAGAVRSDRSPVAAVAVRERAPDTVREDQFSLTLDERGLRSDWREGADTGSLRLDVGEQGLAVRAHARGPAKVEGAAARCDCSCARCAAR